MRNGLLLNIASNNFLFFSKIVGNLIVTAACINEFGTDLYGTYLLSFGLVSSLTFLDFGLSKGVLRFAAEYHHNKDEVRFFKMISNALFLNLCVAIVASFVPMLVGYFSGSLFDLKSVSKDTAARMFYVSSLYVFVYFLSMFSQNLLQGFQLFRQRNVIQFVIVVLNLVGIWVITAYDCGIIVYCIQGTLLFAIGFIFDWILIVKRRVLANYRFTYSQIEFANSELFSYSKKVSFLSLASLFSSQADKIVLSVLGNVGMVTVYSVLTRPYFLMKSLFTNSFLALEPVIVKNTQDGVEKIKKLVIEGTRLVLLAFTPVVLFVSIFFNYIISVWLRTDEYRGYLGWGVLGTVSVIFLVFYSTLYRCFYLSSRINYVVQIEKWSIGFNILLSVLGTIYFGVGGVILGTTAQILINCILTFRQGIRIFNLRLGDIWDGELIRVIVSWILIGIVFFVAENVWFPTASFLIFSVKAIALCFLLTVPFIVYVNKKGWSLSNITAYVNQLRG